MHALAPGDATPPASAPVPANPPPLEAGQVHLWRLALDRDGPDALEPFLAAEDLERAGRFAFEADRKRFLRARSGLRRLLGAYLGLAPRRIAFALGPQGKPELDPPRGIGFSLSHSGDLALVAVSRQRGIGIDVEQLASRANARELAGQVLAESERRAIEGLPEGDYQRAFLTAWTRKEACLKALGVGLTMEPAHLAVGTQAERASLTLGEGAQAASVDVESLDVGGACVAALAVVGGWREVQLRDAPWAPPAFPGPAEPIR